MGLEHRDLQGHNLARLRRKTDLRFAALNASN